jgi:hypothetical protein
MICWFEAINKTFIMSVSKNQSSFEWLTNQKGFFNLKAFNKLSILSKL